MLRRTIAANYLRLNLDTVLTLLTDMLGGADLYKLPLVVGALSKPMNRNKCSGLKQYHAGKLNVLP